MFPKREIPIVSLAALHPREGEPTAGPAVVAELADRLRGICHDIGFFIIVDHGISAELIADVFDLMRRFFALPEDVKVTQPCHHT